MPEDIPEDAPAPVPPERRPDSKSDKSPDYAKFQGIIGILVGTAFTVFLANGGDLNCIASIFIYVAILVFGIWSFLFHASPHKTQIYRYIGTFIYVTVVFWLGYFGTSKQYRREHPIIPMLSISMQTIPGLPEAVTNQNLRYVMLSIRNPNEVEINDIYARLQLPEPISATVQTDLPPGTVIAWEPLLSRYTISGTGNKSFLGPNSARHYSLPQFQPAYYFPGNHAQISGFSEGADLTGVWQLAIDKLASHGVVSLSFLTDNEGDCTNYIVLANTGFKTNGASISVTMRGDGKGGVISMQQTLVMIINTNYSINPHADWHFGTNWLRFYFEGSYQYLTAGVSQNQHFLVPFIFDTNNRSISAFPVRTDDGNWRRVMIEYQ